MIRKMFSGIMLTMLLTGMLTLAFSIQTVKAKHKTVYVGDDNTIGPWVPTSTVPIDWNHYHNYTEIVDILLYLNTTYPSIVDVFSIGTSWQNREIYCVKLTNESASYHKPKVLFVGYHHTREVITAELPLYFVVNVTQSYGSNEVITRSLNLSEIYVVVALNVDGFDLFEANDYQRKNAHPFDEDEDGLFDEDPPDDVDGDGFIEGIYNETTWQFIRWEGLDDDSDGEFNEDWVGGVDLNRNYGYAWSSGSPDPRSFTYRGPAPFSEPETQAIRDLALQHDFKYAISFHSGIEVIYYPWGHAYKKTLHDSVFKEVAKDLSELVGAPYRQLPHMSGGWDDWMYGNQSIIALTCEIFENESAWFWEQGTEPGTLEYGGTRYHYNPQPHQIKTVILRWLPVFTYITNRTIKFYRYPTIQAAINAASPGDTIYVGTGTYYEHVVVNKTVSLVGEECSTTIIDGGGTGNVVTITMDDVYISGLTIQGGEDWPNVGIYIKHSKNCTISGNQALRNGIGIALYYSYNSSVIGNTVTNNKRGIELYESDDNTIYHNNFINNTDQVSTSISFSNNWDDDYSSGGNYWSDYVGSDLYGGPYQNETASDGIGDSPYTIDADNKDEYPLMRLWTSIDAITPVSIISLSGVQGTNGWYTSDVTATLYATDYISGVAKTEYSFDDSTWLLYETPFNITSEGTTTIHYRSTDAAGKIEAAKSKTVKIDKTPASLNITSPSGGTFIASSNITISWSGSDATSGIDHYEVRWDTGSWMVVGTATSHTFTNADDGDHATYVKAVDKAGNSKEASISFYVDTKPPIVTIASPTNGTNFNTTSVTVAWSGLDVVSGIDYYMVRINNESWTNIGANTSYTFVGLSEEPHVVSVKAIDKVGYQHDVSTSFTIGMERATELTHQAKSTIDSAKGAGFWSGDAKSLLDKAITEYEIATQAFNTGDYENAKVHAQNAISYVDQAYIAESSFKAITTKLSAVIGIGVVVIIAFYFLKIRKKAANTPLFMKSH